MTDETKKGEVKTEEVVAVEVDQTVEAKSEGSSARKQASDRDRNKKRAPRKPNDRNKDNGLSPDFEERVVAVNRVAKVVKGGRRFSFSALMVVGDKKGKVGYGLGKAKEVPEAIRKATQTAQRNLINVPLDKGTIPHETTGRHDAGMIYFKPASEGTGVKAAGACRAILELAGVSNVLTKSVRGNNPHNIVKATFHALKTLRSAGQIAETRGKDVSDLRIK